MGRVTPVVVAVAQSATECTRSSTAACPRLAPIPIRIGLHILLSLFLAAAITTTTTCSGFLSVRIDRTPVHLCAGRRTRTHTHTNTNTNTNTHTRTTKGVCVTLHEQRHEEDENAGRGLNINRSGVDARLGETETETEALVVVSAKDDLDRNEQRYIDTLEEWYDYSQKQVRCPFFRRRYGDVLDHIESMVRFFLIRPYCRDSSHRNLGPLMAYRSTSRYGKKTRHLPVEEIMRILCKDWRASEKATGRDLRAASAAPAVAAPAAGGGGRAYQYLATTDRVNEKGYYVTGKLSQRIYRDDCEFQSPDPDLPIRGIRKYVGVASQLFHTKSSYSKLLSLEELKEHPHDAETATSTSTSTAMETGSTSGIVLKATWKMSITINLPWKPQLSEFTGSTLYFLDEDHLVARHREAWDISVKDAFFEMMNAKNLFHKKSVTNTNTNTNTNTKTGQCPLASFFGTNHLRPQSPSPSPSTNTTMNYG